MIASISLIVLFIAAGSFAIWSFVNYSDQKNNVDTKVSLAVAEARKIQSETDEAKFAEREKEPRREFVGPSEYGRLTFDYPKTWSVYVENDGSDRSAYKAYLHPVTVPPLGNGNTRIAMRVTIENQDYDQVLSNYSYAVQEGNLRTSNVEVNGNNGVRLDGAFSENIRGSLVLLRVRDKTVSLRTDADTFKPDFDKILKTVNLAQ